MHRLASIYWFLRLGRPHFLVGGFLFYGLGAAVAVYNGATFEWPLYLWGQTAVTAIQLMTHYANDYFDLLADQANQTPTAWSGGSRVLTAGVIQPRTALAAAIVLALAAGSLIFLLLWRWPNSLWGSLLLALALLLAWEYSAPPLRLHSSGWGELTTAVVVTGLTPLSGYYLQIGQAAFTETAWLPFLVIWPLCCLQFAMLLAIEFPDATGDAAVGKRTLVVRWGSAAAARLYQIALLLTYASLPLLLWAGLPAMAGLALLAGLPLALWQSWRFRQGDWARPSRWGRLAFGSIALLMGTAVAQLLAFGWLIGKNDGYWLFVIGY